MQDDFDPSEYVQPGSPEALRFKDGAKVVDCSVCQRAMMLPLAETRTTCLECGAE